MDDASIGGHWWPLTPPQTSPSLRRQRRFGQRPPTGSQVLLTVRHSPQSRAGHHNHDHEASSQQSESFLLPPPDTCKFCMPSRREATFAAIGNGCIHCFDPYIW
uniref:Uncharacterized protein n=1 Tax=Zea mays TaxID=4577 RepID=B6UBU9_MAIZE|nr:hypothetical protein [Zea mays]